MFIGHYGVALAAKKFAPKTSLGTLFFAAQFLDLIMPLFVFTGIEHFRINPGITAAVPLDLYDYPWSHSLVTVVGWSVLVAGVFFYLRLNARAATVVGALVASHWFLDVLMHRPDVPLYPGGETRLGLGIWNSIPATIAVEFAIFAAGFYLYLKAASPLTRKSRIGLWFLGGFLVAVWLGSIFGPPPPSATAAAASGLGLWLLVLWGAWIDRGSARPESG